MEEIGLSYPPRRKLNDIMKTDREAWKSEDLLKRNFKAKQPLLKCVTDITRLRLKIESCISPLFLTVLILAKNAMAYISMIVVRKMFQKMGVGKKLLN